MGRKGLMLTFVLLTASAGAWAETPATLLEKGFYKEQAAGDLDGAIAIYRQIIADAAANRRYVAEAHLRLGLCLMKTGKAEEAAGALRTVIEKYADQPALVAQARKHLPAPAFPEFVGCRIQETLKLTLDGKTARAEPVKTIAQASRLVLDWQIDAATAKQVRSFAIGVESAKIDSNGNRIRIWKVQGLPGDARSIVFAQSDPGAAKLLVPGEYTVFVCAYDRANAAFDLSAAMATARAKLTVTPLPRTQIQINDVQPDGTIRFRGIGQRINRSAEPLTELRFVNSDFVKLERMTDDAGKPISFTTTHRDNAYHYVARLNTPVPPGEPILNCSEGVMASLVKTDGDLHAFRMRHWPAGDEPTRRIEVYRLPAGAEVIETTPPDMARRVRDGRTELFVEKLIPLGGSITTAFQYRLSGVGSLAAGGRKAYIPDADTKGIPIVLDLATGEMLKSPQGGEEQILGYFKRLGKGDLAFDKLLIVIRGGKAERLVDGKAVAMKVGETWADGTAYDLSALAPPVKLLITTGDGKEFDVTILGGRDGGIDVEYSPRVVPPAAPKASKLDIGPAPWADGEVMRLLIKTKTGVDIGMLAYTARMMPKDLKAVAAGVGVMPGGATAASHFWRLESYMAIPMTEMRQFTRVDADLVTFAPTFGWTKNTLALGDFQAEYAPGEVTLKIDRKGKTSTQQIKVDGVVYDNEQAVQLIRRLPLRAPGELGIEEGYSASFPIFPVQGGTVVGCRIDVVGKEKVSWVGGEMECHKVLLSVWAQGIKALEHTLWFSADKHRWLVRYDSGMAEMVLLGQGTIRQQGEPWKVDDRAAFLLPAGWFAYLNAQSGPEQTQVEILPPEMAFWSVLMAGPRPAGVTSVRKYAEGEIARVGGFLKDYKVRKDSWRERTVSSLPAAGYVADYAEDGQPMVEARTCLLTESKVYWFVFRTAADKFDAQKAAFDKIVDSLTYKARSGVSKPGD
ncbi:MAG TPA: tetratricopeptide repeat protein [Phycisphaerae bacterium]|nr:tetratricopeptide repeat protein [Phycisphaerae bacterium]